MQLKVRVGINSHEVAKTYRKRLTNHKLIKSLRSQTFGETRETMKKYVFISNGFCSRENQIGLLPLV
jgi:hypothetical protein